MTPRARVLGSAILEVLSGLRTPREASEVVGISLQRYYQLEVRAVEGLVAALEARPRGGGRRKGPEREVQELRDERDRLQRELQRANALVRVAQRTVGLRPAQTDRERDQAKAKAKGTGKRGPRRPTVRARTLAARLRAEDEAELRANDPTPEPAAAGGDDARKEAS